ncbi:MAG TPA: hypothetical protein VMU51_07665, partial [Mycobacteriales bacterium]|nr:hypothetical protein [Mycobacteriales bacterium]
MHRAAYAALGLADWRYDRVDCGEADLAGFVAGLGPEWAGCSLTMPLKRAVLDVAADVSPLAWAVGAANTLVRRGGGWRADNTDVAGIVAALREAYAVEPASRSALGDPATDLADLADLSGVGPDGVGPSNLGPDGVGPSGVGPGGVGPSNLGRDGLGPGGVGPSGVGSGGVGPSSLGPGGVGPSGLGPSNVGPGGLGSGGRGPSGVGPSGPGPGASSRGASSRGASSPGGSRPGGQVVLLGAGGTAQAALAALRELGVPRPTVLVRDSGRAGDLGAAGERLGVRPTIRSWAHLHVAADADLVISTVPAGAADVLADLPWRPTTTVLDVVYSPWPTPLAAAAGAAGCRVVSGLSMLLYQAAVQVRLM